MAPGGGGRDRVRRLYNLARSLQSLRIERRFIGIETGAERMSVS